MSPRAADNIARKFVTQSVGFWHILLQKSFAVSREA